MTGLNQQSPQPSRLTILAKQHSDLLLASPPEKQLEILSTRLTRSPDSLDCMVLSHIAGGSTSHKVRSTAIETLRQSPQGHEARRWLSENAESEMIRISFGALVGSDRPNIRPSDEWLASDRYRHDLIQKTLTGLARDLEELSRLKDAADNIPPHDIGSESLHTSRTYHEKCKKMERDAQRNRTEAQDWLIDQKHNEFYADPKEIYCHAIQELTDFYSYLAKIDYPFDAASPTGIKWERDEFRKLLIEVIENDTGCYPPEIQNYVLPHLLRLDWAPVAKEHQDSSSSWTDPDCLGLICEILKGEKRWLSSYSASLVKDFLEKVELNRQESDSNRTYNEWGKVLVPEALNARWENDRRDNFDSSLRSMGYDTFRAFKDRVTGQLLVSEDIVNAAACLERDYGQCDLENIGVPAEFREYYDAAAAINCISEKFGGLGLERRLQLITQARPYVEQMLDWWAEDSVGMRTYDSFIIFQELMKAASDSRLSSIDHRRIREWQLACRVDPDSYVAETAKEGLERSILKFVSEEPDGVIEVLELIALHPGPSQLNAIEQLSKVTESQKAFDVLAEIALKSERGSNLAQHAITAIGKSGNKFAIPALAAICSGGLSQSECGLLDEIAVLPQLDNLLDGTLEPFAKIADGRLGKGILCDKIIAALKQYAPKYPTVGQELRRLYPIHRDHEATRNQIVDALLSAQHIPENFEFLWTVADEIGDRADPALRVPSAWNKLNCDPHRLFRFIEKPIGKGKFCVSAVADLLRVFEDAGEQYLVGRYFELPPTNPARIEILAKLASRQPSLEIYKFLLGRLNDQNELEPIKTAVRDAIEIPPQWPGMRPERNQALLSLLGSDVSEAKKSRAILALDLPCNITPSGHLIADESSARGSDIIDALKIAWGLSISSTASPMRDAADEKIAMSLPISYLLGQSIIPGDSNWALESAELQRRYLSQASPEKRLATLKLFEALSVLRDRKHDARALVTEALRDPNQGIRDYAQWMWTTFGLGPARS